MNKRLVITGMGAVTPIGTGVDKYWNNLIDGVCGIERITRFDVTDFPVQIAAEVKDFDPVTCISPKLIREMDVFQQYAFAAAHEALTQSGFPVEAQSSRIGVVMGTAMNGVATTSDIQDQLSRGKTKKVSPRFIPKIMGNLAPAQFTIAKGIHGPSYTLNTSCSSGGDALSMAATIIMSGQADAMVVMGGESSICEVVLGSLAQARVLSKNNTHPKEAIKPFDINRDGFALGEGGGALIIESLESAVSRGAEIYAELAGFANTSDGYHVMAPDPSGKGVIMCMELAMQMACLSPADIGYINANGTSTVLGDVMETHALKAVFGENVPPVSSTKGATGHIMGAGGITEIIACIQAIRTGMLPPTLGISTPDPECDLDYIPGKSRRADIDVAMSNSFGFGGQNSSVIIKRYVK